MMTLFIGMKIKLLLVDLNTGEVTPNLPMRAEHGWTVGEFKGNIGKVISYKISTK